MLWVLFAKSVLLGLAAAAPLGPIGTLCINRTLERGFWAGVAGGVGTAMADALYAVFAAAGFAAFAAVLAAVADPLAIAGGLFMVWLGWRGLTPRPVRAAADTGVAGHLATVGTTFLLTLANPMTILFFVAVFASLGLVDAPDPLSAAIVIVGVFAGSLAWWFALSGAVALLRNRLPDAFALWVSRISGVVLIGFGLAAFATVLG